MQVDGLTNDEVKSHLQVIDQPKHKHQNSGFISNPQFLIKETIFFFSPENRNTGFTFENWPRRRHQAARGGCLNNAAAATSQRQV